MNKIDFIKKYKEHLMNIDKEMREIVDLCMKDDKQNINESDINNPIDCDFPFDLSLDEGEYRLSNYIDYLDSKKE